MYISFFVFNIIVNDSWNCFLFLFYLYVLCFNIIIMFLLWNNTGTEGCNLRSSIWENWIDGTYKKREKKTSTRCKWKIQMVHLGLEIDYSHKLHIYILCHTRLTDYTERLHTKFSWQFKRSIFYREVTWDLSRIYNPIADY